MTIPELIERVLVGVRDHFYHDQPPRNFLRDRTALIRAVSRYGYACHQNGWEFQPVQIVQELLRLLPAIKAPDHQWFPRYLESCIDRHVRQRAEELQQLAQKNARPQAINGGLNKLTVLPDTVLVREPGAVELLNLLHRDLRKGAKRKKPARATTPKTAEVQPALF